mmetsp:Transcript_9492/g.14291  ORF Transcript_9492/g.14291 Transcript_9492/m.14291 type:complete len:441 (+) Transcript_9492:154-1476(+)|eukprot:CAMPEP_0185019464 /NCGR_PEP_ID=MMETSP1103-20130426/2073_1 /TAXON_ID=36769 /ORGANISM="Paraphysomonas bandaiensis, Strain Caron Lab Isolate" /LENGTH=440 /DNA_ID=CAMNT_0027549791 /DNA_START=107 /DNA_END=1429 /DNA_ORIENTATION=+
MSQCSSSFATNDADSCWGSESITSEADHFQQYKAILSRSVSVEGPNARPQRSFGGTIKIKRDPREEKSDHYSMTKELDKWKSYNHLGQTSSRPRLAKTYGKLLDGPGPADYSPNPALRSTEETAPTYTLHSRVKYDVVDKLVTPGPGSYPSKSCIQAARELLRREPKLSRKPPKEKIGPGYYNPTPAAEFSKFHREVKALMPRRDEGHMSRKVIDKRTLHVQKAKKKQKGKKVADSHLGPGTYFHPTPEIRPVTSPEVNNTTLTRKVNKFYDVDPMSPARVVHTLGVRRPDAAQIKDAYNPGPGSYSPEKALFGDQLLLEGGGSVTRPGKPLHHITASEGPIRGQHAPAISSITPLNRKNITMKSELNTSGSPKKVVGTWKQKSPPAYNYKSQYACAHKKPEHVIYRKCGRIMESSVKNRDYVMRGSGSSGAFMRFNVTH